MSGGEMLTCIWTQLFWQINAWWCLVLELERVRQSLKNVGFDLMRKGECVVFVKPLFLLFSSSLCFSFNLGISLFFSAAYIVHKSLMHLYQLPLYMATQRTKVVLISRIYSLTLNQQLHPLFIPLLHVHYVVSKHPHPTWWLHLHPSSLVPGSSAHRLFYMCKHWPDGSFPTVGDTWDKHLYSSEISRQSVSEISCLKSPVEFNTVIDIFIKRTALHKADDLTPIANHHSVYFCKQKQNT